MPCINQLGVASDCRTHKCFLQTIFLYLYKIFVYIYFFINKYFISVYIYYIYREIYRYIQIYIYIYNIYYMYIYIYIYILYIYIYIYIYLSIKHRQCTFLSMKVFVCVVSVCLFMNIHLSGYISFVFKLIKIKRLHQKLSYLQPKLSATAGPPMPSPKIYFGRDIQLKSY